MCCHHYSKKNKRISEHYVLPLSSLSVEVMLLFYTKIVSKPAIYGSSPHAYKRSHFDKLFSKQDENMPVSSSSRPPNPLHSIPFINVRCWSIFLRNWRELVCGWAHYGATSMGGYCYHYKISSYALTHGPVVISRLDDHTLVRPTLHLTHMRAHTLTSPLSYT